MGGARFDRFTAGGIGRPASALAAAVLLVAAACTRPSPGPAPVRLYASPDLPGEVVRDAARRLGVAPVTLVASADLAEVAWLSDPVAALDPAARLEPGSAPETPGIDPRWQDPKRRFAPACARARVLLLPRAGGAAAPPFPPSSLGHVVDPRLAGMVALAHPARGRGPVAIAALALQYGDGAAERWLRKLAANRPVVVERDDEVRAAVADGRARVGLAGTVEAAAGAMSRASLEVVYPDQGGKGTPVLPTAVGLLPGAGEGARKLAAWLVSRDGEAVLVGRVPGLLPLRPEVPVPLGVRPAGQVVSPALDWGALAARAAALSPALARWPEAYLPAQAPAAPPAPSK